MFDNDHHSNGIALAKYRKLNGKEGLLSSLKTSETYGIDSNDSELTSERINAYGTNAARPIKIKGLCELVKEQLEDTTLRILIGATILSLSIGLWRDFESYHMHKRLVRFYFFNCLGVRMS